MKEQYISTPREAGAELNSGVEVDLHAANPDILSYEELQRRRKQEAYDLAARASMEPTVEQRPLSKAERLGQLNVAITALRSSKMQEQLGPDQFDLAA